MSITDASQPTAVSDSFQNALAHAVRGEVRFDRLARTLYACDAGIYEIVPQGVLCPQDLDDLVATRRGYGSMAILASVGITTIGNDAELRSSVSIPSETSKLTVSASAAGAR